LLTNIPISDTNATSANEIARSAIDRLRNDEFCSTLDRYRTATNATAAVSIEAIYGICSLLSMAKACSQAVLGLARTSARGNSLRSVAPGGGVARYGGKMT
jgi:hypothetical protein